MFEKTKQKVDNRGVSPVIGVILMVAITVIIAAVIGTFVLGFADNLNEPAQAGVEIVEESDSTIVRWTGSGNAESVEVLLNGTQVDTLDAVGDRTELAVQEGETVSALAKVNANEEGTIVKTQSINSTSSAYESSMNNSGDRIVSGDSTNNTGGETSGNTTINFTPAEDDLETTSITINGTTKDASSSSPASFDLEYNTEYTLVSEPVNSTKYQDKSVTFTPSSFVESEGGSVDIPVTHNLNSVSYTSFQEIADNNESPGAGNGTETTNGNYKFNGADWHQGNVSTDKVGNQVTLTLDVVENPTDSDVTINYFDGSQFRTAKDVTISGTGTQTVTIDKSQLDGRVFNIVVNSTSSNDDLVVSEISIDYQS